MSAALVAATACAVVPATAVARPLHVPARAQDGAIAAQSGSHYVKRFWAGVDLGATVPGTLPGELAPTRADYDRWLRGMGALGANLVRVYTLMKPRFYEALAAYDRAHPRRPIRLMQGVWIDEERFLAAQDAYAISASFDHDIAGAVRALHGDATLPPRRGYASGRYRADVSRWLLAWSIGVEWDPQATKATNDKHAGTPPFRGRYVAATADASPMETWLAARMNGLAALEARLGWSRPLTFTNWVTDDPLAHPGEPLANEDLVSLDAAHVTATPAWPGGVFASYHAYPYYPDFLSLGEESYAGYLRALRAHHGSQPVMITEFGVPSSLGVAHAAPLGRDQGAHPEQRAGAINAAMLREIKGAGMAGGVLFEWIDEWFKHTWNTEPLELPFGRRALWRNDLTNEEHFGVLSADPVAGRPRALGHGIRAQTDPEALTLTVPTRASALTIGLDVRPGAGGGLPGAPGVAPQADVAVQVNVAKATVLQAASWEPVGLLYGASDGIAPAAPWQPARQLISHPLVRPDTGQAFPAQTRDVAALPVRRRGGGVAIRLPWALLGFSDPSSLRVYVPHPDGSVSTERVGAIGVTVAGPSTAAAAAKPLRLHGWNRVSGWVERRKRSWSTLAGAFRRAGR